MEEVDLHDASLAYHQIAFDGVKRVFFEDKAGILFANKCCDLLVNKFQRAGGHYLQGFATVTIDNDRFLLQVNGKKIESDRYVFACGPWTRQLFPDILQNCTYVSKHDVYHFAIPPQKLRLFDYQHLPVWLEYDPVSPLYYGMPMHLGKGFKIAYDDRSDLFDPDADDRLPNAERLKTAREFVHRRFPLLTNAPISYTEVCQYDNSIGRAFHCGSS